MDSNKTFAEEKPDDVMHSLNELRQDIRARDESLIDKAKRRGGELYASAKSATSSVRERASEKLTSWSAAIQRQIEKIKQWYGSRDDEVQQP